MITAESFIPLECVSLKHLFVLRECSAGSFYRKFQSYGKARTFPLCHILKREFCGTKYYLNCLPIEFFAHVNCLRLRERQAAGNKPLNGSWQNASEKLLLNAQYFDFRLNLRDLPQAHWHGMSLKMVLTCTAINTTKHLPHSLMLTLNSSLLCPILLHIHLHEGKGHSAS